MARVQDRDDREHEAVRDRGQKGVPVGIEARSDGGADDVEDARERRPNGGLPDSLSLVTLYALRAYLVSLYVLRFPFSSYS